MTFKIQIANLEGSEILHMRPIKPWSNWDRAVAVAHFGAAAALTVLVGLDVTASAEQAGMVVPQDVTHGLSAMIIGIAAWDGIDAYRKSIHAMRELESYYKRLPQLSDKRLQQLKEKLEKSLRALGDRRTIRFIDFDDMNLSGRSSRRRGDLKAVTTPLISDEEILIGVNVPFVKSRDEEAQFVVAAHEVSHNYAPLIQMAALWGALSKSNIAVVSIALGSAYALNSVSLGLLAVASLCAVPILRQAYYRRLEFQSDRGAAYLTANAEAVHRVLRDIAGPDVKTHQPIELEITDRRMYRYPRLYRAANRVFQSVDRAAAWVYATHPPVSSRLRALKVLAKQQAYQKQRLG